MQAFVQKKLFIYIVCSILSSLGNILYNLNSWWNQQKPVLKAQPMDSFFDSRCFLKGWDLLSSLKSYSYLVRGYLGPDIMVYQTPHVTSVKEIAGVCGWPTKWPPGAPVMAELDPQWHLSEKLLLQGPCVGVVGWDGQISSRKRTTCGLNSWIGELFCNIEAALPLKGATKRRF